MINNNRIVSITTVDLLSMYGLILLQNAANANLAAVNAVTVNGEFEITEAATPLIANEPVHTVDFATGVSTATLYFVAAFDYVGFTINHAAVPAVAEDGVLADGHTLYKAVLAEGAVTITKVGF